MLFAVRLGKVLTGTGPVNYKALRMNKLRVLVAFFVSMGLVSVGFSATDADKSTAVRKLLGRPQWQQTKFSICFYDLSTGKKVFSYNPATSLMPASNMKLVTSAAALKLLGEDFVYRTSALYQGGNLVIVGSGDPLIGDPRLAGSAGHSINCIFKEIYRSLVERDIDHLSGQIIVDASIFDDVRFHPSWPENQADKWYTAQVSAVNFNNNCLDVTFIPDKIAGKGITYSLSPDTRYARIKSNCKTASKGSNKIGATRKLSSNDITLIGKCRTKQTINVTIDRPSAYFAYLLAESLLARGISIHEDIVVLDKPFAANQAGGTELLYEYVTPLWRVLNRCNQNSLNMAAECLFKSLGAYSGNSTGLSTRQGSWQTGRVAVDGFLKEVNAPAGEFIIDDGCGLSRNNRLSANTLVAVLKHAWQQPYRETFQNSLATSETGTLSKRNRFNKDDYRGRIYAKTGYISKAWALSGYCRTMDEQWLAFSIIANGGKQSPRKLIDSLVREMMK
jgi:D-alanyl-D-alanine carboxypeptidase/D-alanyl-D-alanine-endopeptidase (penicillin-binding protein 4)